MRFPRVAVILLIAAVAVVVLGPPYAIAGRAARQAALSAAGTNMASAPPTNDVIGPAKRIIAPVPKPRACRAGLVSLTYDDGPSPTLTPKFVRALQEKKVPDVTFFMIGAHVSAAPGVARMVARAGFQIGNHTWDHPQLTRLPDARVRWEIQSTAQALHKAGITPSNLVRPPYGDVNARVARDIRKLHKRVALWTIDPRDWAGGSGQQIAARALAGLRPHAPNVILDHDGVTNSPNTLRALPIIVRGARERGYCFTRLGANGKPAVPAPTVTASVTKGAEAGAKTRPVVVTVRLSRPTTRPVSVRLHTADGSAQANYDYKPTTVIAFFPVGATKLSFTVPIIDDKYTEPTENFWVLLDRPRYLTIDPSSAKLNVTVTDDDPPGSGTPGVPPTHKAPPVR